MVTWCFAAIVNRPYKTNKKYHVYSLGMTKCIVKIKSLILMKGEQQLQFLLQVQLVSFSWKTQLAVFLHWKTSKIADNIDKTIFASKMFTFTKQNNNIIINYSRFYKYHELPTKKYQVLGAFLKERKMNSVFHHSSGESEGLRLWFHQPLWVIMLLFSSCSRVINHFNI